MKRIFAFVLVLCLMLTSCGVTGSNGYASKLGASTFLSVKVFQTLSNTSALAFTDNYNVVRIESAETLLYDGLKLSGTFVLIDTYTYTTEKEVVKTVPVYIMRSEYKRIIRQNKD